LLKADKVDQFFGDLESIVEVSMVKVDKMGQMFVTESMNKKCVKCCESMKKHQSIRKFAEVKLSMRKCAKSWENIWNYLKEC